MSEAGASLRQLAEQDPVSRPLALLQAEALELALDSQWSVEVTSLTANPPMDAAPLLHQSRIAFEQHPLARLHATLISVLESTGVVSDSAARLSLRELDPARLAQAALEWDSEEFTRVAEHSGVQTPVVITIGHCLALPIALKASEHLSDRMSADWEAGYCPTCGNWPLLAEQRGLERQFWLRCSRCLSAWRGRHQHCIFCGNTDHRRLGYLAPEDQRESRRANTCQECRGYLKVFATVMPHNAETLLRRDLESLELDMAALEKDFKRPERPGASITVQLDSKQADIRKWIPWA